MWSISTGRFCFSLVIKKDIFFRNKSKNPATDTYNYPFVYCTECTTPVYSSSFYLFICKIIHLWTKIHYVCLHGKVYNRHCLRFSPHMYTYLQINLCKQHVQYNISILSGQISQYIEQKMDVISNYVGAIFFFKRSVAIQYDNFHCNC